MSRNDLILRGEVEDILFDAYDGTIDEGALAYLISELKKIPAVPHEMSAREFANEFRRMCDAYLNCMEDGDDCPLFTANICSLDELVDIVPIVEQWAKEHPEKKRKTYEVWSYNGADARS